MVEVFDKAAGSYSSDIEKSISLSGKDHDFFTRHKASLILDIMGRMPRSDELKVLDIGCGVGLIHPYLVDEVGQLEGVDISEPSLEVARKNNPGVSYAVYEGQCIPYPDGSLDVAFTICVLHHVPPAQWISFLQEMKRVLRPGGKAIIIEHNPFNPVTNYIVRTCELDADAVLLSTKKCKSLVAEAGFSNCDVDYVMFLPFEGRVFRKFDKALRRLPLGAQYIAWATA